jgi:rod shape-determining protein MreC
MDHYQQPAFFVRGPSPVARLIFFSALSIALMAVDARLHYLTEIRQGFAALLHPLEVLISAPLSAIGKAGEFVTTQHSLVIENRQLRAQALQQGAELQRFRTMQAENDHLRGLLGVAPAMPQPAWLAEVVHAGRDPFTRKVIVNLGSQQGVETGQAVVDEIGVVGQVTRVYSFSSEVTLVTDKDLAVPIQVERNGLRAIAFGDSRSNAINLPYLPVNVDIREGDTLVTSGIDGVYPAGLAVARVARIQRQADSPFARIACMPVAGIESHRQVLLVAKAANIPPPPEPAGKQSSIQNRSRHASRKP